MTINVESMKLQFDTCAEHANNFDTNKLIDRNASAICNAPTT